MQQTITKKNWAKSNPQFLSALIVVLHLKHLYAAFSDLDV